MAGGVKVGKDRYFFKDQNAAGFNLGAGLEAWKVRLVVLYVFHNMSYIIFRAFIAQSARQLIH